MIDAADSGRAMPVGANWGGVGLIVLAGCVATFLLTAVGGRIRHTR